MITLTDNEVRLLFECAKIGRDNLTNGVHPTTRDKLDLMNINQVLKGNHQSIKIKVTGERVAGINGKKWKIKNEY